MKKIIVGNWKMYNLIAEAIVLAKAIKDGAFDFQDVAIVLAPPFTALHSVGKVIAESAGISLAAQNMYCEDRGAFTGEISPSMLKDVGCTCVIIGHSERRKHFHEQDKDVNLKVKKALAIGLTPIMCVGETDEEKEKGITKDVITRQIKHGLSGVEKIDQIVIAYEPVWAIGTGKVATPMQAQEIHFFIRSILQDLYGAAAKNTYILYGGSVTKDNISDLIAMKDIGGALVGGASLKGDEFLDIIRNISKK